VALDVQVFGKLFFEDDEWILQGKYFSLAVASTFM
jgi:hypothetical protein